jgi:outer membrane protein assembly factor BamB
MKRRILLLFVGCLVSLFAAGPRAVAENRTWTDASGDYQLEAELVGLTNGVVQLKKADGTVVGVPISRLSSDDRLWVARNRRSVTSADANRSSVSQLVSATEWPRWRGPNNNGISMETGLLRQWPEGGPPLAWSTRGLGRGYSSIAISQGKLITMGKKSGGTMLICVSADNGSPLWELPIGGNKDPNCTPTVDPDSKLVFALTSEGVLVCADIETGREIWRKDFESDLKGRMMSGWGYSESPLVDGDRLICTPGSDRGVMAALDKRSGEVVWQTPMPGGTAGYSSPVISNGGGVKQYVTLVGKGLIGVRAADGKLLWNYPAIANSTANVPTPIVGGDYVFGSSGYNDGGSALLRLTPAPRGEVNFQEVYYKRNSDIQNHHGGMVLIGDHVFMGHGHNNGFPLCLDLRSGRTMWGPERGPGKGSAAIVAADGHLYFRYEDGVMALIEANPQKYNLKGTFAIKSNNGKSWSHPVIASKKLFLRDQDELHCYDIAE